MPTLIETLAKLDESYYNHEAAISDAQYDALREEARLKFPNDPYWSTVGAAAPAHLTKAKLTMHMGSQNKANTAEELSAWYASIGGGDVLLMEKLDGSSVEVTYVKGRLSRAITRGDGAYGSDITANAVRWSNIPLTLKRSTSFVVRGEAMMLISTWRKRFTDTANPRNAANGTVMRKSGLNNEAIMFTAFDCAAPGDETIKVSRLDEMLLMLADLGFATVPCLLCRSLGELNAAYKTYVDSTRNSLDYEIDGLVLSHPNLATIEDMGYADGGTRPRGQIAWKFPSEKAVTKVTGITLTMGLTGAIIPTASLEPVRIGGVTVSNVLLNNFVLIEELGVNVGDLVVICRAGDVIPHLESVKEKALRCPCCGFVGLLSEQVSHHAA